MLYAENCYAECRALYIVMLNVVTLIVVMLSVVVPQNVDSRIINVFYFTNFTKLTQPTNFTDFSDLIISYSCISYNIPTVSKVISYHVFLFQR
jgi:hypothetical protein